MDDIKEGLEWLCHTDLRLAEVIAVTKDVPLRLRTPGFAGLSSIIISQQVSRASAEAIYGRLTGLVDPLEADGLLAADESIFRRAGLSRPKQRALLAAANAVTRGDLDLHRICRLDASEAMAAMCAVKGIGPWTAEIYLMFCAGHGDIFPAGDLALQEAARVALGGSKRPSERELRESAAAWSPWRSVAARLLWAYYRDLKSGRDVLPV